MKEIKFEVINGGGELYTKDEIVYAKGKHLEHIDHHVVFEDDMEVTTEVSLPISNECFIYKHYVGSGMVVNTLTKVQNGKFIELLSDCGPIEFDTPEEEEQAEMREDEFFDSLHAIVTPDYHRVV